jgi:branched-chain amino acid transport system permease protein
VLMVYLGGRGTLWGPLLGALLLVPAQQLLAQNASTSRWYLIFYSAVFLIAILLLPRGIIPSIRDFVGRITGGRGEPSPPVTSTGPVHPKAAM